MRPQEDKLIAELRSLPPEMQSRVGDFIILLKQDGSERAGLEDDLRRSYAQASEKAFSGIWDNDDDAIYDAL